MKVLFIRNVAGTASLWCDAMAKCGHDALVVLTNRNPYSFAHDDSVRKLKHILPYWRWADLVIVSGWVSPVRDLVPYALTRKPVLCVLHGTELTSKHPYNLVGRLTTKLAAHKVFLSTPWLKQFQPDAEVIDRPAPDSPSPLPPLGENDRLRIIHSPTNRRNKGTKKVLKAVQIAKRDGAEFDFHLMEGLRHEDLLRKIAGADIVIDQIETGTYGMISIEAMSMGRIVVCYISKEYDGPVPIWSPRENDPVTLARFLKRLCNNPIDDLKEIAIDGLAYVQTVHNAKRQCERFLAECTTGRLSKRFMECPICEKPIAKRREKRLVRYWLYPVYRRRYVWRCGCGYELIR